MIDATRDPRLAGPTSQDSPRETTVPAVALGVVLAAVLAVANTYLGLCTGLTLSAAIPASVIAIVVLRSLLRGGTLLENNAVQTLATSGESLAAGLVFSIPALLVAGTWSDVDVWTAGWIAAAGGVLGVVFGAAFRRSQTGDSALAFPESRACAEVLRAGETGATARPLWIGAAAGGLFKLVGTALGFARGPLEGVVRLGNVSFYAGAELSPALVGIGCLVGLPTAATVLAGGLATWLVALPWLSAGAAYATDSLGWFWEAWHNDARYLGVGALLVASLWSVLRSRALLAAVRAAVLLIDRPEPPLARTETEIDRARLAVLLVAALGVAFLVYRSATDSLYAGMVMTFALVLVCFLGAAAASHLAGLFGQSHSPLSGLIVAALVLTGVLLGGLGLHGEPGIAATLAVAAVVACAAAAAGDVSQSLRTGYLVGATPRAQEWLKVAGVAVPALVVPPVLKLLHHAYGIGTGQPGALKVPQATLFASVARGLFGEAPLPWSRIAVGAALAAAVVLVDQALAARGSRRRINVMALALGMFLPITLTVPLFAGALAAHFARERGSRITLAASGLIAGESLAAVLAAAVWFFVAH